MGVRLRKEQDESIALRLQHEGNVFSPAAARGEQVSAHGIQ